MTTSISDSRYAINGLVKTDSKVMDNLAMLCAAAGCWLTYDYHEGKWSVIINRAGQSQWSFNDSNIIGPLNISATGVDALYNSAKITYPHEDLQNQTDFIQVSIPQNQWLPNEQQNTLNLNYQVVTNPVQAQLLGFIELKQSRVDKIVNFVTDYSKIAVKAGDLIDITNSVYGWTNKIFRVITVKEIDNSEGGINVQITGLEYDASVYDESNLVRYQRDSSAGITTLGNIVTPTTPTVTTITTDARPRVNITTQVSGGIVEKVEFWITNDVPPGVQQDSNRTYTLLTTVTPSNGSTFPLNTDITASADNLSESDFLIKCRAINSEASSAFSSPSGMIQYRPVQTTQNIDNSTKIGGLVAGIGAAAALGSVVGALTGNSAPGGLFSSIFGTLKSKTGVDLTNPSTAPVVDIQVGTNAYNAGWRVTQNGAGSITLEIGGGGGGGSSKNGITLSSTSGGAAQNAYTTSDTIFFRMTGSGHPSEELDVYWFDDDANQTVFTGLTTATDEDGNVASVEVGNPLSSPPGQTRTFSLYIVWGNDSSETYGPDITVT